METEGEKKVWDVLSKLDRKRFFYVNKTRIATSNGSLNPDFVVVSADYGLIVGEVKDYKRIERGSTQQELVVFTEGNYRQFPNPEEQARKYALALVNQCEKRQELLRGSRLAFPWQHVVVLTHQPRHFIEECEKQGIFTRGIVWGKEDIESPHTVIEAIKRLPWKSRLKTPLDISVIDILRGILNPSLVVRDAEGREIGTLTIPQEFLSTEALKVTESLQIRLVRGVAGSGKTLVLRNRVHYLRTTYPQHHILILTYNKQLSENLKSTLEKEKVEHVEVATLHAQCNKIFRNVRKKVTENYVKRLAWIQEHWNDMLYGTNLDDRFVDEEIKWRKEMRIFNNEEYLKVARRGRSKALAQRERDTINLIWDDYKAYQDDLRNRHQDWMDWEDVPLEALRVLNERRDSPHRAAYDVILVDEAQDFTPVWIDIVKAMLKPNGSLFLCDDPTQSIFSSYSWKEKGLEVVGRTKILRVPFRNTRQIATAAHALIGADDILNSSEDITKPFLDSTQLLDGNVPLLRECSCESEEDKFVRNHIKKLLRNENTRHYKVGVIVPKKLEKQFEDLNQQNISVVTIGTVKGLEFDAVYIVDLSHQGSKYWSEDPYDVAKLRREIFTAMTRARYRLIMTYHGRFPSYLLPILEHVHRE